MSAVRENQLEEFKLPTSRIKTRMFVN